MISSTEARTSSICRLQTNISFLHISYLILKWTGRLGRWTTYQTVWTGNRIPHRFKDRSGFDNIDCRSPNRKSWASFGAFYYWHVYSDNGVGSTPSFFPHPSKGKFQCKFPAFRTVDWPTGDLDKTSQSILDGDLSVPPFFLANLSVPPWAADIFFLEKNKIISIS